ncbi:MULTISPECIES: hypothetical protein [unclassified Rathayibacter]|uniref:hypothetical protein n=1 Tax=unclassified Rathayibacter TaxID=2609250 RepID=UPI000F4CAA35|nr:MULTISPECIES: hypothetical protein [unclassified Rathayibacter]ROP48723.1 hypothetical protein EDF45_2841 [Rathayibacter sp. PhB186]ROS49872.1 hypothetical protein EDF44_2843 [Rathayibacter sp. PhB185]
MTAIEDSELRRLVRSTDPAEGLAPLTRAQLAEHRERAMGGQAMGGQAVGGQGTDPHDSDPAAVRRRRSPWLIVGVGALAVGAAASLLLPFALGVTTGGSASALRLPATGGPMDQCAPVTAEALAPSQLAFRAEVASIDDGTVTLRVIDRFAGDVGDAVTVTQAAESAVDGAPIVFERGIDYLIAADGDTILTCGLSAADSPELTSVYREAFAQR